MKRVLVIGLDGATLDLVQPWVQRGALPLFARMLEEGAHGVLCSVPNTDTAPAWSSFATGLGPGRHGLFNELGWTEDRHGLRLMRGGDRVGASFWAQASAAGRRVIAINVPFSYPAEAVQGVVVAGIDAPSKQADGFCLPADFIPRFERAHGNYVINANINQYIKAERPVEGIAVAKRTVAAQAAAARFAMAEQDWQLCVVAFGFPDEMQHFFWQQMLRDAGPQREAILDAYRFIEQHVAKLMDAAGPETNLLIASDHGFGPICATPDVLANFLVEAGFLHFLPEQRRSLPQRVSRAAYGWARSRFGEGPKEWLRRSFPALRERVESDARFAAIDWTRTRAYVAASPWEIYVNLRGREPHGCVAAGAEYEAVLAELMAALANWRDETGRPRLRAIRRREECYSGPYAAKGADLTLVYDPQAAPLPENLPGNTSRFDGEHQPEGLIMAMGPAIRPGVQLDGANLIDVAPTILRLLDVAAPDCDGQVIEAMLRV
jgi:predicted AlkP superfamily phosphohydrolase/phosphomutase